MKKLLLCMLALLLLVSYAQATVYVDKEKPADWPKDEQLLRLTVFRTGEGDAMLLEVDGKRMMIDGGPNKYREKLRDALAARGITHLDAIYSTHPHDDHIDGLYRLMQYGVTADEFISSFPKKFNNSLQKRTVQQADKMNIPFRRVEDGDEMTLGGAKLTFYQWYAGKTVDAKAPMTRIEYGDATLLLTSDIIGDTQRQFLQTLPPEALKADIVKAPHHGLTGFKSEFLTAVDPEFVFITNYDDGSAKKTVNQCVYRKIPYLHSASGTVIMETNGTDWYVWQLYRQF